MASDWVKMRANLFGSPKVIAMAQYLANDDGFMCWLTGDKSGKSRVTIVTIRHVTVSLLLVTWGNANEHTTDGKYLYMALSDIDEITGAPSFGDALASVGWAVEEDDPIGVRLINFTEYNTPQKRRPKTNAERQAEYRGRKKGAEARNESNEKVTKKVTQDKRREESNTPLTPQGGDGGHLDSSRNGTNGHRRRGRQPKPSFGDRLKERFRSLGIDE